MIYGLSPVFVESMPERDGVRLNKGNVLTKANEFQTVENPLIDWSSGSHVISSYTVSQGAK